MEPWEAPLRGWSSSFGGMARSGEHRRWEMGVEWIDVFWLCWQTKMIQEQKQTYYIGEMFFFLFGGWTGT